MYEGVKILLNGPIVIGEDGVVKDKIHHFEKNINS